MDCYINIIMFVCLIGSIKSPSCQAQPARKLLLCRAQPRTIQFLSFFPCTNSSSVTLPEECDIFAYAAAQLAVEKINSNSSILSNYALELLPIATKLNLDPDATLFHSIAFLNRPNIGGVIGPSSSVLASRIAPIVSTRLKKLEISYGATYTPIDEDNPYFYRSLPSDKFLNEGKLALLARFSWYKVGILSSTSAVYRQASESFYRTFETYLKVLEIAYSGSFTSSPRRALQEMARVGLRIVIGLFGPDDARRVICEARRFRLTTSEHVWILPSYYSPHWWEPWDVNCTREEMMESLNSSLFVDGVKFSLADKETPLEQFNQEVLQKTRQLFPAVSLSGDLSPFLMFSQARRAYDAVWLLTAAWNEALSELDPTCSGDASVNNNCTRDGTNATVYNYTNDSDFIRDFGVRKLQGYLEEQLLSEVYNIRGSCFVATDNSESEPGVEQHYFGHVLISQFIGGSHCPIGIFWPNTTDILAFVRLSELSSHCLGPLLQLDTNSFGFTQNCPIDFWWKGRAHNAPPTGGFSVGYSGLGTGALVTVYVLIALALIFAATMMVLNITLRKNKYMKASSPSLSVIVILGAMMIMLTPLYHTLVVSAHQFGVSPTAGDILCQLSQWSFWLAFSFIFVTLTVKNYRVYRVFYNKELKQRGSRLTDSVLFLAILMAVIPVLILLILSTAIGFTEDNFSTTLRFDSVTVTREPDPYDYNFLTITYCNNSDRDLWEFIYFTYNAVVLVVLIYLSWQNSKLSSRFREEGVLSHYAIMVTIIGESTCLFVYIVVRLFLSSQNYVELLFSILFLSTTVFAVLILGVLFLPLFYRIHKDYRTNKTERVREGQHRKLTNEYLFLVREALRLKEEVMEKETQIQQLKQKRTRMRQQDSRASKELDTT